MNTDNQQATPLELAYLAGVWDGEGSFGVSFMSGAIRRKMGFSDAYHGAAAVVNQNEAIIVRVVQIMDALGVKAHIHTSRGRGGGRWRDTYRIKVARYSELKKLIEALLPYLVGKKPHAELLLRFVNSRLSRMYLSKGEKGYNEEELSLYEQLKKLNFRGAASEAIRQGEFDR